MFLGFGVHCFALLCIVLLCIALHCFALLCIASLCFALLCIALLYFALHCFALLCSALQCSAFCDKGKKSHVTLSGAWMEKGEGVTCYGFCGWNEKGKMSQVTVTVI